MDPYALLAGELDRARRLLLRERALDLLSAAALGAVVVLAAAVVLAALSPDPAPVRWTLAWVSLAAVAAGALHLGLGVRRRLRRAEGLGRVLRRRLPAVGHGVEAVEGLREAASREGAPFAPGLLEAEAARVAALLGDAPPEVLVRPAASRLRFRLAAALAGLAVALAALAPWFAARGVRNLLGVTGRLPVSWLVGPPSTVGVLAYDLKTVLVVPSPSGGVEHIPGDESGDVTALPGVSVEVSGRLFRPATSGSLVLREGDRESRVPLAVGPDGTFGATFTVRDSGLWHLSVVVPPGMLLTEEARRRITVADRVPPRVTVEGPERPGLEPGMTASLRWTAESATGIAGVDAVYSWPLEPDRPPVRVHLRDVAPGVRQASGTLAVSLPGEALERGGRVDVVIEAFGRLSRSPEDAGRGEPVRLFVDVPSVRRMATVESWQRLHGGVAALLADVLDVTGPGDPALPPTPLASLRAVADQARRAATAAAADPESAPMRPVLDQAAGALEEAGQGVTVPRELARAKVEAALLALDEGLGRERRALLAGWLADLERFAGRLRELAAAPGRPGGGAEEAAGVVGRSRRVLRWMDAARASVARDASLEGGPSRLVPRLLGEAVQAAREALAATEAAPGPGSPEGGDPRLRAAAALDRLAGLWRLRMELRTLAGLREVVLPAELDQNLRLAGRLQREVMDRTAQTAYVLKRKADALFQSRAPDTRDLSARVLEASEALGRPDLSRLDRYDAEDVARLAGGLGSLADLVAARDLDSAARVARDAADRAARLAVDLRDAAEYGDAEAGDPSALRSVAARVARAAEPLEQVARALEEWRRQRERVADAADRREMAEQRRMQDRAGAAAAKVADGLRRASGGEAASAAVAVRRNMEEASRRLAEGDASAAEVHQRQAIQDLNRLRRLLERGVAELPRRLPGREDPDEPRLAPAPDRRSPDDLEQAVRAHLADPVPEGREGLVKAYYEALLRP